MQRKKHHRMVQLKNPADVAQTAVRSMPYSRADLHLHTVFSDGLMTPEETVDLIAARTDLRVIAITDHDTVEGAVIAQSYAQKRNLHVDVIVGQEVTTGEGDVLALFVRKTLPTFETAAAAITAIHAQGGLAVAAHPFGIGVDCVGRLISELPFDAIEARHGCPLNYFNNWRAHRLNQRLQRLPELGSSDAHIPHNAGEAYTRFPGHTAEDLRQAILSNRVVPGGWLWTPLNLLRTFGVIVQRGWPVYVRDAEVVHLE
jgi:predicted metal-dependent phosphoesterase TrpH